MRTTIILTGLAVLALAATTGDAMAGPGRGGAVGGFGTAGGGMAGDRGGVLFERFDADDDGRVTRAEIDAALDERRARFDADGDGALNLEEFEPVWLELMRPRLVDHFQALDADGDGVVTAAELEERVDRMMRRADVDGDGAIGPDDRRAPMERMGGRGYRR
ncbi:MAG: EF-hand domain-containing protein [Alphaproteobacteria bacterium]